MAFVYIIRCCDDTLYVGHTHDLLRRERQHNEGTGSRYTAERRPVAMVYAEEHTTTLKALRREKQLKRWTRQKKEALIAGDVRSLKQL